MARAIIVQLSFSDSLFPKVFRAVHTVNVFTIIPTLTLKQAQSITSQWIGPVLLMHNFILEMIQK